MNLNSGQSGPANEKTLDTYMSEKMEEQIHGRLVPVDEWKKQNAKELSDAELEVFYKQLVEIESQALVMKEGKAFIRERIAELLLRPILDKKKYESFLSELGPEERRLVSNITVHSLGSKYGIILDKVEFASDIREKTKALDRDEATIIYFGSADDLESAILTGFRNIIMVDPSLNLINVKKLLDRIKKYDPGVSFDEKRRAIHFSYKGDNYSILVFERTMQDFNETVKLQCEAVMLFNKTPDMPVDEAKKALREGGFYFDNRN